MGFFSMMIFMATEIPPNLPEKDPLAIFKEEMAELKKKEEEAERGKQTVHFRDVNPDDLTDEDREMWESVKASIVKKDDFEDYRQNVDLSNNQSRQQFCAFLANKIRMW